VFINYAFYSEGFDAQRNFRFYLQNGIKPAVEFKIDYGVVLKGVCELAECLEMKSFLPDPNYSSLITVLKADNNGFDFGSHGKMLKYLHKRRRLNYDFYIFLNCGSVGPILPSYMPPSWHWASAFIGKMTDRVGLVGTSISCLPREDVGGYGPIVEGFAFALSASALRTVLRHGTSFNQHKTKRAAIVDGEFALTRTLMRHNVSIDCLLLAYEGIDWFDEKNWGCNGCVYPSREASYFNTTITPLEVIFHKMWWRKTGYVNRIQTEKLIEFANNRNNREARIFRS